MSFLLSQAPRQQAAHELLLSKAPASRRRMRWFWHLPADTLSPRVSQGGPAGRFLPRLCFKPLPPPRAPLVHFAAHAEAGDDSSQTGTRWRWRPRAHKSALGDGPHAGPRRRLSSRHLMTARTPALDDAAAADGRGLTSELKVEVLRRWDVTKLVAVLPEQALASRWSWMTCAVELDHDSAGWCSIHKPALGSGSQTGTR